MLFERHLRWIRSDVLSIRRAEKEWMAGRLPVKSLRVSTSSLACFCHKLLFGPDLIRPSTPRAALCRPSGNLQHQAQDARREAVLLFRCTRAKTQRRWRWMCFCELYQSSPRDALRIGAVLFQCRNLSCLVAESSHTIARLAKDSGSTIWS